MMVRKNIKLFFTAFMMLFCYSFLVTAQGKQGKATYVVKKSLNMKLDSTKYDKDTRDKLIGFFQKQFQKEFELHFNENESVYKEINVLESVNPQTGKSTYNNFSSEIFYKNSSDGIYVRKTNFLDKIFLIKDTIPLYDWNIEKEQKYIGLFNCFKATNVVKRIVYEKDKGEIEKEFTVVAWFTPEIPIIGGPAKYGGLPGLILEVNDGEFTMLCKEVTMGVNDEEIKAPKGGKKVDQEEFVSIQIQKKMEGQEKAADFFRGVESNVQRKN